MSKASKERRNARRDMLRARWSNDHAEITRAAADALRDGDKPTAYALMDQRDAIATLSGYEHATWALAAEETQAFLAAEAERAEWRLDQWNGGKQDAYQSGDQGDPFGMGFRGWLGWETPTSITIEMAEDAMIDAIVAAGEAKNDAARRRAEKRMPSIVQMLRGAKRRQQLLQTTGRPWRTRRARLVRDQVEARVTGVRLPHDPSAGKAAKTWQGETAATPVAQPALDAELQATVDKIRALPMPPLVEQPTPPEPITRPERRAFVVGPDYIPGHAFEPPVWDSPKRRTLRLVNGRVMQVANYYRGGEAGLAYHERYATRELSPRERALVARIRAGQ